MSPLWEDLLGKADEADERVLPWTGGRKVGDPQRVWRLSADLPPEHGWFLFRLTGRDAECVDLAEPGFEVEDAWPLVRGVLVGDRLIPDDARVVADPNRLIDQTRPVHAVERGLERFCRAVTVRTFDDHLVFLRQDFPEGPEDEVLAAFQDRRTSVDHIAGVPPALDLAFRWVSRERMRAAERAERVRRRREEEERRRVAEEQRREEVSRRLQEVGAFETAAREALRLSGAELLDVRPAWGRQEMVVQYRFRHRRFECVVDRATLRVTDSGICLTDEVTGERGDERFTLASLPPVVAEAMDRGVLVVYRHG